MLRRRNLHTVSTAAPALEKLTRAAKSDRRKRLFDPAETFFFPCLTRQK
jgi:hypothetical protein